MIRDKQAGVAQFLVLGFLALGLVAAAVVGRQIQSSQDTRSSAAFVETMSSFCCQGGCDPSKNQCESVAGSCPAGWNTCLSTGSTGTEAIVPTRTPTGIGASESTRVTPTPAPYTTGEPPRCGGTVVTLEVQIGANCTNGMVAAAVGRCSNGAEYRIYAKNGCDSIANLRTNAENYCQNTCSGGINPIPTGGVGSTNVIRITPTPGVGYSGPMPSPYPYITMGPPSCGGSVATFETQIGVGCTGGASVAIGSCTNGVSYRIYAKYNCESISNLRINAENYCRFTCPEGGSPLLTPTPAPVGGSCGVRSITPTLNSCTGGLVASVSGMCSSGRPFQFGSSTSSGCDSYNNLLSRAEEYCRIGCANTGPTPTPMVAKVTITPTPTTARTPSPTPSPIKPKPSIVPQPVNSCNTCPAGVPAFSLGNANCDSAIDMSDRLIWMSEYTSYTNTKVSLGKADFNCDKKTDTVDYAIWSKNQKIKPNY